MQKHVTSDLMHDINSTTCFVFTGERGAPGAYLYPNGCSVHQNVWCWQMEAATRRAHHSDMIAILFASRSAIHRIVMSWLERHRTVGGPPMTCVTDDAMHWPASPPTRQLSGRPDQKIRVMTSVHRSLLLSVRPDTRADDKTTSLCDVTVYRRQIEHDTTESREMEARQCLETKPLH